MYESDFYDENNKTQPEMKVVERGRGKADAKWRKFWNVAVNVFAYGMFASVGLSFVAVGIFIIIGVLLDGEANDPMFGAFLFLPGMFIFLGLCATGVGIFIGHNYMRAVANKKLKKTGRKTIMPIESVTTNNSSVNHVPGFILTVKNVNCEQGFMRKYTTKPTYDNRINVFQEGDVIPVYVDEKDPSKFYLDIEVAYQEVMERINNEFFE